MVSNIEMDEKNSKRCKKKLQTVADFRKKISFLKSKNLNDKETLTKGSNKSFKNLRCNIIDKSVKGVDSTSGLGQYNNKSVRSTINEEEFDLEINRNSANSKIITPSLTGCTMPISNFNRKSTRKIYRRKLSHYRSLIRLLINVRAKDLSKNITRDAVRCLKKDDKQEFPRNILSIEFTNKNTNAIENDKENDILSSKIREIDVQIPRPKYAARKSVELSKIASAKIIEGDYTRDCSSRSINIENFQNGFEKIDDKLTDRELNFEKNCESDNDATIPRTLEINKHLKSKDKNTDKKVVETWLQKCIDPFEFDDSDVVSDLHRESVKDTKLSETRKKTERVIDSVKKNQSIECIELEENPSIVNKNSKASFTINGSNKPSSKKTVQRSSSKKNDVENTAVYIPDSGKGGETSRVFLKSGAESKKDKRAEKISKKSEDPLTNEGKNSKQPELIFKSKPATGNYCSCKRKKCKNVKTSSYPVPANIEYPCLNIREGCGNRSTAVKSDHDIFEKEKTISRIGEKKTKIFYSPLELEYSDTMQLKLDPNRTSKNRSILIDKNSSKLANSSLKEDKVAIEKSAERVSKLSKKFSISNFTLSENSPNNNKTETKCSSNNSKSSKIPTFSKYSIPVSIEINMTKDNLRKRFLNMNLIQSKITSYFPLYKVQNKTAPDKNSNLNTGVNDFDENGNRMERKNIIARPKAKSRTLPVIESDVMLKDSEKLMCLKKLSLQKPQLSISRKDYLYGVITDSELVKTCNPSNSSITCRENIGPIINSKKKFKQSPDIIFIEDSNCSIESVIPPSYSIFSDDDNNKSIIDIDKILDTQAREGLLAPWESVKIFDKINHWHEDTFEP